jgi:hypothetical protein
VNPERVRDLRGGLSREDETLVTFDMLRPQHDARDWVTLVGHVGDLRLLAAPPTLTLGPDTDDDLLREVADPSAGLARSVLMAGDRRAYLMSRWEHWRDVALGDAVIRSNERGE